MRERKRATIKDVAAAAGVSTASVSQALRPRKDSNIKLQEKKIELIRETAKRLNYMPHAGARSIRSRRFGTVGYFTPKALNLYYTPYGYQHGVHDALEEKDYRITLIRVSPQLDQAKEEIPNVFNELNLDALIVESYGELAAKIYELYRGMNFPFLYLNDRHESNSVYVDDVKGADILTRHALEKGYRKICFVHRQIEGESGIEKMHHSAIDRETGYSQAMVDNGLDPAIVSLAFKSVLGREESLSDEQWDQLKDFDALIAYDDDLANAIARKGYDLDVRVPDDIALASFNGDYASLSSWRPLTTMLIPAYDMGLAIGRMATQRLQENNGASLASIKFTPTLIEGRTL
jgi:LacI family transcriptional regulator